MSVDKNLAQTTVDELLAVLAAGGYLEKVADQAGVYYNAALGATWVDLTSASFTFLGDAGVGGPVACAVGNDFLQVDLKNEGATTIYLVLRAHYVGPGPGFVPENPVLTAEPIPAGGSWSGRTSMVNNGAAVTTISVISSAPGGVVRVTAYLADR